MNSQENHGDLSHAGHGAVEPGGLLVSQYGYTLVLHSTILMSGRTKVVFMVVGPDGGVLTEFVPLHEKWLHFIAIRRDMTGFQHVHPVMDEFGTWAADLVLVPGDWRFFADFQPPRREPMTLGIDASVAGTYDPQAVPDALRIVRAGAYTVTLFGGLSAGTPSELTFNVTLETQPVNTLEPYLGSYGHLVALRSGDLAYLHVHPQGEPGDGITKPGPEISFFATAPSAGRYRVHLDFQHEGIVHSAHFTVEAARAVTGSKPSAAPLTSVGQVDDHTTDFPPQQPI
ncbi:hypothetical protein E3O62_03315 [Cryobacterium sp. TMT2-15-1]|uniref:hypothetical protein n=1 Tax=Cryobacterium sp. TMT2-15-1 TaxID=1259246 RepID=UPI00106BFE0A|nr:hypothetical protein [Cryobacterium sp. TMT2-15-1]TFC63142.1 hypothetical protein E3O62_03315 [Cryobacterium sp. TMT2-15-1]